MDGATHLLEHARCNGGCLMVPRFVGTHPDITTLYEAGLIEIDLPLCTDEIVAFFVVGFERIPQDFSEIFEEAAGF